MSEPTYRVVRYGPTYDLESFDCGEAAYNDWLRVHAATSVQAGVCAVYLLIESTTVASRVVGYFAINPTQVVRGDAPASLARGWPSVIPAWKIGKLAVHVDLRAHRQQWGRHLLREALLTILTVAEAGGGKVIVVDADNPGLVGFYVRNGFTPTGTDGSLSVYLKVSTARKALSAE